FYGLQCFAPGCIVRGFVINDFNQASILVGADETIIVGDFLGTNSTATQVIPSQSAIELDFSNDCQIGVFDTSVGPQIEDKNVIAGSFNFFFFPAAPIALFFCDGTIIQNNLIGVDKSGTQALGQSSTGIFGNLTTNTLVGGDDENARNVISGNTNSVAGI